MVADTVNKSPQRIPNLPRKEFKIDFRETKNQPFLTLEYLSSFLASLHQSFTGSDTVINPAPGVLKIIANYQVSTQQKFKFDIAGLKDEDYQNEARKEQYIHATLYPDDVIAIIAESRRWLTEKYHKKLSEVTWAIDYQQLHNEWQKAVAQRKSQPSVISHPIANFSRNYLQKAVTEILEKISTLLEEGTPKLEFDSIDPILSKINEEFVKNPIRTWQTTGVVITAGLEAADLKSVHVTLKNKTYQPQDIRKVINRIFELTVEQFTLLQDEEKRKKLEKPWHNLSPDSRLVTEFSRPKLPFFSQNDLQKTRTDIQDKADAARLIELFENLIAELKKEPVVTGSAEADEADEDGGGEDAQEEKEKTHNQTILLAPEEVRRKVNQLFADLKNGLAFSNYFSEVLEELDDKQVEWLLINLPAKVSQFLDQADTKSLIATQIDEFLSRFELENEETRRLIVDEVQWADFQEEIVKNFFAQHNTDFLVWIATVEDTSALEDQKPVQPPEQEKKAQVTPTEPTSGQPATGQQTSSFDSSTPQSDSGLNIERAMAVRDLTTSFLGLNFGKGEGEFLREIVYEQIFAELNRINPNFTKNDLRQYRFDIFRQLQLNEIIFKKTTEHYEQRLRKLASLQNAKDLPNIFNTIDSILVLVEDPQEYLSKLSDKELQELFGLEDNNVNPQELRKVLLGLLFVRRAHFYINNATPVSPWRSQDKQTDKNQLRAEISQLRQFVQRTDMDGDGVGVTALNSNPNQLEGSSLSDKQKEIIKQLYQDLWLNATAGKDYDDLVAVYNQYGVYEIEIDYSQPLPIPEGFIYSQMAQGAENGTPAGQQFFSRDRKGGSPLGDKLKQKLGSAALKAVAPELAPVLATLEKMPIIGEKIKEGEKKLGKGLAIFGAALGAGALAIMGWITKSLPAMLSALGGIAGFFIGGPAGMAIGAGLGWAGGKIFASSSSGGLGSLLKSLGGGSNSGIGLGGGASAGASTSGTGLAAKLAKFKPAIHPAVILGGVAGPAVIATATVSQIAGGSQLHQTPIGPDSYPNAELSISQYVTIDKSATPFEIENGTSKEIIYTITIAPKDNNILSIDVDKTKDEWSYLGGDPLSLPDKTQDIIDALGTDPIDSIKTITYKIEMKGKDVAVNNTFDFYFDVVDESGTVIDSDHSSEFASVMIGKPDIGCLEPGPAGKTVGSGGNQRVSQEWGADQWAKVVQAYANHVGKSTYLNNLLCSAGPIVFYRLENNYKYGGWFLGLGPNPQVGIYNYALTFSPVEFEYTVVHELGHVLDNVHNFGNERWTLFDTWGRANNCFGYPGENCNEFETFAESFTLSVAHPSNHKSLDSYSPEAYNYFVKNVLNGEKF